MEHAGSGWCAKWISQLDGLPSGLRKREHDTARLAGSGRRERASGIGEWQRLVSGFGLAQSAVIRSVPPMHGGMRELFG
jgi:hypothetical protein